MEEFDGTLGWLIMGFLLAAGEGGRWEPERRRPSSLRLEFIEEAVVVSGPRVGLREV